MSDRFLHILLHGYALGHHFERRLKKKWINHIGEASIEAGIMIHTCSFSTCLKSDVLEKLCSQCGLPAVTDSINVAVALSEVCQLAIKTVT